MFGTNAQAYDRFRATIKIWIPTLQTLDGTDFKSDAATITQIKLEIEKAKPGII